GAAIRFDRAIGRRQADFALPQNRAPMAALVWHYLAAHRHEVVAAIGVHALLSGAALGAGIVVGVPAGIWSARRRAGATLVALISAARVVPSLAVLTFVLPLLGLGFWPALVALSLLAIPPILINAY